MGIRKAREQDLVQPVLQLLKLRGVMAWRVNSGAVKVESRFVRFASVNGVSDVLGVLPGGRFLAVELKTPGGRLRESQRAFLGEVSARGGLALVVSSLDQLDDALRLEGYGDE